MGIHGGIRGLMGIFRDSRGSIVIYYLFVEVTADLSFGKLFTVCVVSDNFSRLRPGQLADPAHRVNCGQ